MVDIARFNTASKYFLSLPAGEPKCDNHDQCRDNSGQHNFATDWRSETGGEPAPKHEARRRCIRRQQEHGRFPSSR